jgi:hypothetical protein
VWADSRLQVKAGFEWLVRSVGVLHRVSNIRKRGMSRPGFSKCVNKGQLG